MASTATTREGEGMMDRRASKSIDLSSWSRFHSSILGSCQSFRDCFVWILSTCGRSNITSRRQGALQVPDHVSDVSANKDKVIRTDVGTWQLTYHILHVCCSKRLYRTALT